MKLNFKLLLAVLMVFGVSTGLIFWILNATFVPSFAELERDHAIDDAGRVVETIQRESQHLESSARDWAFWDDTRNFVLGRDPSYLAENLYPDTLNGLSVNALYVLDRQGTVLWSLLLDLDTGEEFAVRELPGDRFVVGHPVLRLRPDDRPFSGLVETQAGLLMISAAPILDNDWRGPPAGTFILGRLLTSKIVNELKSQTGVAFDLVPLSGPGLDEADQQATIVLKEAENVAVEETGDNTLTTRTLLRDITGAPVALVRVITSRSITQIGHKAEETAFVLLLLTALSVLLTIAIFAQWIVIAPIKKLTRHVASIGNTGVLSEMEAINRGDEIGLLKKEFDTMIRQLAVTRKQLVEQSYYSGKAESTAGILHNVRNALHPINMSLWRITESLKERSSDREKQTIFAGHEDTVLDDGEQLLEDVSEIVDQHRRIEEMLTQHDTFTRYEQPMDCVDLAGLIREAAQVISSGDGPKVTITWPPSTPAVMAHRILLLQVLSNLFINAREAIATAGLEKGEVRVTCGQEDGPEGALVHIAVADNGIGISNSNLGQIFERGYSTRSGKNGGLGLHWSVNCLAGMNGRIEASSDGPGKGATFHVYLPIADSF
ncbi:HAMP domain-containing protein [Pelagibius litoralis]|uniref:histidine kinase n=1 Tax=Pelagibius litoralis TaxID=374515 RepID=A0A967F1G4_9PROT|nr:CHASE4 domain-containing protein [Pelagibius litoralis]NIA71317.1 HAMP domain-containing protein [Pelagibius litoralis]